MKLVLVLALLMVLCGCAAPAEPTVVSTTPGETQSVIGTEPADSFETQSTAESGTGDALKIYPLGRADCLDIVPMGESLLLFSGDTATTLTKLGSSDCHVEEAANLSCSIHAADPAVQVSERGVTYFDERQNALVFLDPALKETHRIMLPGDMIGRPALSADWQNLYYCTADALRCIDPQTGIDRLLKEMYFSTQMPTALHCGDTVIVCDVEDLYGNKSQLYICAENGQLLYETLDSLVLWTNQDLYLALHQDGQCQEILLGNSEQGPTLLTPHVYGGTVFPLLEQAGTVIVTETENSIQLDYYDLYSGKRTAQLNPPGSEPVWGFCSHDDAIWFGRYDSAYGCQTLHRWDIRKTSVSGEASRFSTRYSAENPDTNGLAGCMAAAADLSEKHGVDVLVWTDATAFQPWDYTLVPEYQVPVIQQELNQLDTFLSLYPEGFLEKVAENTPSGRIRICLVRGIFGKAYTESLDEAMGLQYWDDNGDVYLTLAAKDLFTQTACHELFHIIESRVLSTCLAYDDWDLLNPKGFQYDYDYVANLSRDDTQWTEGITRAFIDLYSMSYPKEDRARIMEYAMAPGNKSCFETEIMQKKLRQLCIGIRQAMDLEDVAESFLWEQYLDEPLYS